MGGTRSWPGIEDRCIIRPIFMWRVSILAFSLSLSLALAICAQEMPTSPKEHGLAGKVQSVETSVVDTSTKSYKLRPDGREELEDFGNPSDGSLGSPLVWEALRFDGQGKLVEDIDFVPLLGLQSGCWYAATNHFPKSADLFIG
jgi:hypothetical protein